MPRNFEMALTSPSNGCNDLYPLEFAVQLLNGTRDDPLDEVLLNMKLNKVGTSRFFQIVFCGAILLPSTRAKKMLQNDTLCIIFGLVYQELQRSKHCILSERYCRYSMRDR